MSGCARRASECLQSPPDLLPPGADGRLRCSSVSRAGHKARGTPPCHHACSGSAAAPLGGDHPLWSPELPPRCCRGSAALAVNPPAAFLPAFVWGLWWVPEIPSEHRPPSRAPAQRCGGHQPCRASVGAAGLGWGPPGIVGAGNQGAASPWTSVPAVVAHPMGKGQSGGAWGGEASAPAQPPRAWAAKSRGGASPRHGGVPAARLPHKNAISHGCAVNYRASVQRGVRHEGAFVSV